MPHNYQTFTPRLESPYPPAHTYLQTSSPEHTMNMLSPRLPARNRACRLCSLRCRDEFRTARICSTIAPQHQTCPSHRLHIPSTFHTPYQRHCPQRGRGADRAVGDMLKEGAGREGLHRCRLVRLCPRLRHAGGAVLTPRVRSLGGQWAGGGRWRATGSCRLRLCRRGWRGPRRGGPSERLEPRRARRGLELGRRAVRPSGQRRGGGGVGGRRKGADVLGPQTHLRPRRLWGDSRRAPPAAP